MNLAKDFPILKRKFNGKRLVYLDSAATSQKPRQVISALKEFYEKYNANVHRGVYNLSEEATQRYEGARTKIASFIGARAEEIVFTKNCTEALNLLAYSLGKELRDEILISQMEHHSNFVPWQQIALERGAKLKFVEITKEGKLNLASLKKQLSKKTKVVALTHVSNVLGTINPIKEIAEIVHKNSGAVLVIDGAQALGHMAVDIKKLGADFYAFSGHKMLGPLGIGCLYGKRELFQKMKPFLYGGKMIKEVSFVGTTFAEPPYKFEAGTQPIAEVVALGAAVDYLNEKGMGKIEESDRKLVSYALKELGKIPEIEIYGPKTAEERGAVIAFNIKGVHSHDVATILDSEGVAMRGGHHCCMPLMSVLKIPGAARASFHIYNTKEDVDAFIRGIRKVREVFK
ncbi:MAG: Cysteine desulfurase [Parcubacteria group bacterium GW2011_GWB1_49_12]|nr:MAG: Cysteine desulfurase [Parcubacteria group bacterium GW2011_GWB1_49_12]